jgi:hypothetical protein
MYQSRDEKPALYAYHEALNLTKYDDMLASFGASDYGMNHYKVDEAGNTIYW